ncbi:MAG TPA: ABC transporter permease/substrate-binding protein [Vicinamibacteria bacterium]|nr:ABC transporter permease/substrate-binding protein [Vicinamibacteria bacterium]
MDLLRFFSERRGELLVATRQHVWLTLLATLAATAIAVPAGIALVRRPALARPALAVAGVLQTVPSLALFGLLIPLPLVGGIGTRTAVIALVLYALLPILRNTITGLRGVDPAVREAAVGMGMTDGQLLRLVEMPLAFPVILAGIRVAAVVSVGTAAIAAAVGAGGLGTFVFRGIATVDHRLILAGAIPSALLALVVDGALGRLERSRRPLRSAAVLAAAVVLGLVASAAGSRGGAASSREPVVIGSKNFTEQVLLGEILAARLEERGFVVERKLNLGGTSLCHAAVRSGQIDAYVEYTGTALTDVLKQPVRSDAAAVLSLVREGYVPLGLAVLPPLGFNNTFALVVRPGDADARGIRAISDLARAPDLRIGLFGEFLEREDGLRGLVRTYGLRFTHPPREMDLGLLYQALQAREVDMVVGSATDGLIEVRGLRVLEDDRHYFPPYDAVPVANASSLSRHAGLREALEALAGTIDASAMRRMNHAVDGEHRSPRDVAREFVATVDVIHR